MKKLLCIALALLLLAGIALLPASAEASSPYEYYIGENNGYEIWLIDPQPKPAQTDEIIGDYWFTCGNLLGDLLYSPTAIYAVKGEEKVYIKQAYQQGLVNMDEVAQMVNGYSYDGINTFRVLLMGDINRNKKLEIADAILIQKMIAKSYPVGILGDLNDDGNINLEDVILLQKKIAKVAL